MFRTSRRPVGRHTDAYLARRASSAPAAPADAEVPTASAGEIGAEPTVEQASDQASDQACDAPSDQASESPAADLDEAAGADHHDMLCTRCATTLEGDELATARARREAGAA